MNFIETLLHALPDEASRSAPTGRRDIETVTPKGAAPLSGSADDLSEWIPSQEQPWDIAAASHLMRRAGFGAPVSFVRQLLESTPANAIDGLLANIDLPSPPNTWTGTPPFQTLGNAEQQQYLLWIRELQEWWYGLMREPSYGLREKMTLFWHNHFPSEILTVYVAQYFFRQNQLFRSDSLESFRQLVKEITVDPCMLVYLDLAKSIAGNPNENYPRELLELFTLGEGSYSDGTPHYTEEDIVELSRALTGWTLENGESAFRSSRFDSGTKEIFGERSNFGIGTVGDSDVIDLIFRQTDPDYQLPRPAIFLCTKLYRWFVYDVPNMEIVAAMAETLVQSNWSIRSVVRQLLTSRHFYSPDVRGAMIKSPADFVVGGLNQMSMNPQVSLQGVDQARLETHDPVTAMSTLAMILFSPPNVKGWPGGRTWISSVTAPQRIRYVESWIAPVGSARNYGFDVVAFLKSFPETGDVVQLLQDIVAFLLPFPLPSSLFERLLTTLLGGGKEYDWDIDDPAVAQRGRSMLTELVRLAEYQLM